MAKNRQMRGILVTLEIEGACLFRKRRARPMPGLTPIVDGFHRLAQTTGKRR
jgi:hypothetical protein